MSGGHFDYDQYRIGRIIDDIQQLIDSNDDESLNDFGCRRGHGYAPETIERFKVAVFTLHKAQIMAQRIDWLVSGDDGEESFHRRWNEEIGGVE